MCDCDDNPAVVFNRATREARKPRKCSECRRPIARGESYEAISGLWRDGGWQTYHWCAHCSAAQKILEIEVNDAAREAYRNLPPDRKRWGFEEPLCFCFGGLWESVDELRSGWYGRELRDTLAIRLLGGSRRKWTHRRGPNAGRLMPVPTVQPAGRMVPA